MPPDHIGTAQACVATIGCHDLSFVQQCELMAAWQIPLLEMRGVSGDLDLPRRRRLDAEAGHDWVAILARHPLAVRCVDTTWFLERPPEVADIAAWARLADDVGAPWLRVFAGKMGGNPDLEQTAAGVAECDRRLQETGARCRLALETHHSYVTSASCQELFSRVDQRRLGLVWDLHHTWKVGGESPALTWSALRQHIVHVQIKDSISRASDKHPYTYVLPGLGEAPLNELANLLMQDGYTGGISLEWERLWHRELAHVSEALASCVGQPWFPGIRKPQA